MLSKIPRDILFEATEFKETMKDARARGKEYLKKISLEEVEKLKRRLYNDLSQKYVIEDLTMKPGQFRGIQYISTCKFWARPRNGYFKSEEDVQELLEYLKEKYSKKFKLKSVEDGKAKLSIR